VLPGTIADVHAQEVASLMPMGRPFDGFVEQTKRVSPTCLVAFERNHYSVPASFANRPVSLRVYPSGLSLSQRGRSCASMGGSLTDPTRNRGARSMTGTTIWLSFSASRRPAQWRAIPRDARSLPAVAGPTAQAAGGDKEMVEILSLVLHHDEQTVLCAVELALEDSVPTKTHILNILHRLIDGKAPPAPPIDAPQALSLTQEPVADVRRYDTLREMRHAS
jgi:hypothetical protein